MTTETTTITETTQSVEDKPFNFLIARFWPGTKNLNIFNYHDHQVMIGTKKDADYLLSQAIAGSNGENPEDNPWRIVPVTLD